MSVVALSPPERAPAPPVVAPAAPAEAPGAKRVQQACTTCFGKKVRCSGAHPCVRCTSKSLECVFQVGGNSRAGAAKARRVRSPSAPRPPAALLSTGIYSARSPRAPQNADITLAPSPLALGGTPLPPPQIPVRQPYFRYCGLTSISPPASTVTPFRSFAVALTVQASSTDPPAGSDAAAAGSGAPPVASAGTSPDAIVERFYELFESYLPYSPKVQTLKEHAEGTLSAAILGCMTTLVSRCAA